MTAILRQLQQQGFTVNQNTLAILSPYLTEHLRHFGHNVVELDKLSPPLQVDIRCSKILDGRIWSLRIFSCTPKF